MTIERSGESVHLVASAAGDGDWGYQGTVVGDEFSATDAYPGYFLCGGARFDYRAEQHVSGRFSGDGHTLTAQEVDSYRLNSGETVVETVEWSATQQ